MYQTEPGWVYQTEPGWATVPLEPWYGLQCHYGPVQATVPVRSQSGYLWAVRNQSGYLWAVRSQSGYLRAVRTQSGLRYRPVQYLGAPTCTIHPVPPYPPPGTHHPPGPGGHRTHAGGQYHWHTWPCPLGRTFLRVSVWTD